MSDAALPIPLRRSGQLSRLDHLAAIPEEEIWLKPPTQYPRLPAVASEGGRRRLSAKGAALARHKALPPKTTDAVSRDVARRPRCVSVPREAPCGLLPRVRHVARVQQQLHPKTNQEGKEPVMKTYTAYFRSDADWAEKTFKAKTPKQALAKARAFHSRNTGELLFQELRIPVDREHGFRLIVNINSGRS
jgi:hypothetical protein